MTTSPAPTNAAPQRSLDQRMDALRRANNVRSRRAELKASLKSGDVSILSVIQDPPDYLLTAKILDVLMAAPKYGRVKAARVMERCRISPSKTVGGLSDRQRRELIDALQE
jgi:hypothetical protein